MSNTERALELATLQVAAQEDAELEEGIAGLLTMLQAATPVLAAEALAHADMPALLWRMRRLITRSVDLPSWHWRRGYLLRDLDLFTRLLGGIERGSPVHVRLEAGLPVHLPMVGIELLAWKTTEVVLEYSEDSWSVENMPMLTVHRWPRIGADGPVVRTCTAWDAFEYPVLRLSFAMVEAVAERWRRQLSATDIEDFRRSTIVLGPPCTLPYPGTVVLPPEAEACEMIAQLGAPPRGSNSPASITLAPELVELRRRGDRAAFDRALFGDA